MPFTEIASKLDYSLQPLDLSLDLHVKVFLFHFREGKEVD